MAAAICRYGLFGFRTATPPVVLELILYNSYDGNYGNERLLSDICAWLTKNRRFLFDNAEPIDRGFPRAVK
jgi:hypothetical protein